jgi:phosphoenolpyruvate synthase/pyruvate phosphate dikinase
VDPERLNELLHPVFDPAAIKKARSIAHGLPASPGAATGQIVFFADEAEEWVRKGKTVILVRQETSPEDLRGMSVAKGILTARGGMTSHAAVVARGMGKCCISGAGAVRVDYHARTMSIGDRTTRKATGFRSTVRPVKSTRVRYRPRKPNSPATSGPDGSHRPLQATRRARQCRHAG